MSRMSKLLSLAALLLLLVGTPAYAHEGHKADMTDAEMARMEMTNAAPAAAGNAHDAMAATHSPGVAPGTPPAATMSPADAAEALVAKNRVHSASDFLGRLHPMIVHFPIGLLIAALLAELLLIWKPLAGFGLVVRFLTVSGATGAVAAALLGWFAAGWRLSDRSATLMTHRWTGTAIAAIGVAAAVLAFRANRTPLRLSLALLAIAIPAQGYLGGEMVYGVNHLGLF